jgi:hypothetical protein
VIIFLPVIEDGKEVVRKPNVNEWYMGFNDFCIVKEHDCILTHYPIYRRVDLEVDPIKEVWDKYELKYGITKSEVEPTKEALKDYIQKVYGKEAK